MVDEQAKYNEKIRESKEKYEYHKEKDQELLKEGQVKIHELFYNLTQK